MKRVHYLAGAAGLAPVAVGAAALAGAFHATEAAPASHPSAKSVSLHHVAPQQAQRAGLTDLIDLCPYSNPNSGCTSTSWEWFPPVSP
jgi:hypothetical protein